jgi:putative sigma-54 modulation protein
MEIIVSGRQFDVDSALRTYAEEKLARLASEYSKLTSARVVMSEERGRHIVEGHVYGKHMTLNAKGRSHVMHEAIDEAVDKLERQLRKRVDRIHDHRSLPLNEAEQMVAGAAAATTEEEEEDQE